MFFKDKIINVAIQVLPVSKDRPMYDIVDDAIAIIVNSGLKYRVTPFETVVEGKYEEVFELVEKVQIACYKGGAESLLCNMKIQSHSLNNVTIEDKIEKYE